MQMLFLAIVYCGRIRGLLGILVNAIDIAAGEDLEEWRELISVCSYTSDN